MNELQERIDQLDAEMAAAARVNDRAQVTELFDQLVQLVEQQQDQEQTFALQMDYAAFTR